MRQTMEGTQRKTSLSADPPPSDPVITHPVKGIALAKVPNVVSIRAYEVWHLLHGSGEHLVAGETPEGFTHKELTALLYARSFMPGEWKRRYEEALEGMEHVAEQG